MSDPSARDRRVRRRVLLVTPRGRTAGAEHSLMLLVSHLRDLFEFEALCPPASIVAGKLGDLGCRCLPLPEVRTPTRDSLGAFARWWMLANREVMTTIARTRPNIVHANGFHGMLACLAAGLTGRAALIWHARDFAHRPRLARACGAACDYVIAVSGKLRDNLAAAGVNPAKIVVIHNGVDASAVACSPVASGSDLACPRVFANVGQFVPRKKQLEFLEAGDLVRRELPEVRLRLYGDDLYGDNPGYKTRVLKAINKSPLRPIVSWEGWSQDPRSLWSGMDCLVHTADAEPFGRVVIEAMAAGVPVIAVDGSGPAEIIEDEVTGLLVGPGSPRLLARAMLRVAREPGLSRRLADAARRRVAEQFTAAHTADGVAAVYDSVTGPGVTAEGSTRSHVWRSPSAGPRTT